MFSLLTVYGKKCLILLQYLSRVSCNLEQVLASLQSSILALRLESIRMIICKIQQTQECTLHFIITYGRDGEPYVGLKFPSVPVSMVNSW